MIDSLSRVIIKGFLDSVCVPIKAKSFQETIRLAKKAKNRGIKYLEFWLDSLPGDPILELPKLVSKYGLHPYIALCKGRKERGNFRGSEEKRLDILMAAAFSGADFVDIDIQTDTKLLRSAMYRIHNGSNTKIILSYHNFQNTPSLKTLMRICEKGFRLGADIVKIATYARKPSENCILFELVLRMREQKKKVIVTPMGEKSELGRIGCLILGGFLTYVALDKRSKTAEGQFSL